MAEDYSSSRRDVRRGGKQIRRDLQVKHRPTDKIGTVLVFSLIAARPAWAASRIALVFERGIGLARDQQIAVASGLVSELL